MSGTVIAPAQAVSVPPLENGDPLTAHEFLRRFEAMPELKKAELIDGIVHLTSPVRITDHAEPDIAIQWWLKLTRELMLWRRPVRADRGRKVARSRHQFTG